MSNTEPPGGDSGTEAARHRPRRSGKLGDWMDARSAGPITDEALPGGTRTCCSFRRAGRTYILPRPRHLRRARAT
jgi:hypothetical protein